MKIYFLEHITTYKYSNFVTESSNKIMLYPYNEISQQIVNHSINITGNPKIITHIDSFNNRVGFFTYTKPHIALTINSKAEIIKKKIELPDDIEDIQKQWELLKNISKNNQYFIFANYDNRKCNSELMKVIKSIKNENSSPFNLVQNLCNYVNKEFKYKKGITNVFTDVDEVWELKSGVCQDFTNILLQIIRLAGIPARYVSGYVHGTGRIRGAFATHAWVEFYIPLFGWLGIDPTNNCIADINHIRLSVGRNYNDCSPVKGIFKGNQTQKMDIKVSLDTKKIINKQNEIRDTGYPVELENEKNSFRKNLQIIQQQQQ